MQKNNFQYKPILLVALSLLLTILASGCASQPKPIYELSIPGHNITYTFNNDVRQSILVKAPDEQKIRSLFFNENTINIVFNGTNETDNGMFQVALVDITAKVPYYLAAEGKNITLLPFYFVDENGTEQWYDYNINQIDKPDFSGTVLWLKGPATGANETSVLLDGNIVTVQGESMKNLSLASDKLTLIVFGISKIDQITGS